MKIELSKPFAANSRVDEFDVRQIKKALNRLGYYTPYEKIGITDIPDQAIFDALKNFQRDHGLNPTGSAKPKDDTIEHVNKEIEKEPEGSYIWRTVEDGKVRPAHAQYNRTMRDWNDSPDPGDDFNCRCWAEPLSNRASERKKALLGKGQADFELMPDDKPISDAPIYALDYYSEVKDNDQIIIEEAQQAKVNPDLIRAIIYVETTQGYYDRIAEVHDWASKSLRLNLKKWHDSIRPMNIRAEYWRDLGYTKDKLKDPRLNIRAGIDLVKRIESKVSDASIEKIATLYNDLDARRINDYGARVARIMKEKPWLEKN